MSPEKPKSETSADEASNVAKYSGIAFTMLAIIGLSAWLGTWLDGHYHNKTPYYTVGLMVLGLFIALYQVIRSLTK